MAEKGFNGIIEVDSNDQPTLLKAKGNSGEIDTILIGGQNSDDLSKTGFDFGEPTSNNDKLFGEGNQDRLAGLGGNDFVSGGAENNELYGDTPGLVSTNNGDDVLLGGAGKDTLTGGRGADTFVYRIADLKGAGSIEEADVITDFKPGEDKIGLVDIALDDLSFGSMGSSAVINRGNEVLAVLENVSVGSIGGPGGGNFASNYEESFDLASFQIV